MIQMKLQTLLPLTEALPTNRLFHYMANSGVSFIPDTLTASYLDDEYFYNHSGNKQSSPLLEHYVGLVDQTEQEGGDDSNEAPNPSPADGSPSD